MSGQRKILVVDDEEGILEFMQDFLERKGAKVFTTQDTAEGLEIFKRERPYACIIDVHLPYSPYDGIELLRRIREIDKEVICVMLSRIEEKGKIQEAQKLGIYKYIFKPSTAEEIHALVEELTK